jgi:pSer/pThr/pTyr-binding forkhead associated (FHA) protein
MIKIYILKGPEAGKTFELRSDAIYIGRSPEIDVQIRDPLVSRKHLKVTLKDHKYRIIDLQSANGTVVGNEKIDPNIEVDIEEGVPISIGVSMLSLGKPCAKEILPYFDSTILPKGPSLKEKDSEDQRYMEYAKNMKLISKVSDLSRQSLELNDVLDKIMSHILDLMIRIDRIFIVLIDTETMDISKVISKSRGGYVDGVIEYDRGIVDQVIRDKKPVMISDQYSKYDIEHSKTLELPKTGSAICVPLISSSQIRGVIYIDTIGKTHGFRSEDLELLSALGSIIALIIIENSLQS